MSAPDGPISNPFVKTQTIVVDGFVIQEMDGVVDINGFNVYGFTDRKECSKCGCSIRVYDSDFDQHFCPRCNQWEDPFCSDPDCKHCSAPHPATPLPTAGEQDFLKRTGAGWSKLNFIMIDVPSVEEESADESSNS